MKNKYEAYIFKFSLKTAFPGRNVSRIKAKPQ